MTISKKMPLSRVMLAVSTVLLTLSSAHAQGNACSGSGNITSSCTVSSNRGQVNLASGQGTEQTLTVASGAQISGSQFGINVSGGQWNVVIESGSGTTSGGVVSGTTHGLKVIATNTKINNAGVIQTQGTGGWYGISIEAGASGTQITNSGSILATSGTNKTGGSVAIAVGAKNVSITNSNNGNIQGRRYGIEIIGSGSAQSIDNQSGATIKGDIGVGVDGNTSIGKLNNAGTISGGSHAISVTGTIGQAPSTRNNTDQNGLITSGLISGSSTAILVNSAGRIYNLEIAAGEGSKVIGGTHGIKVLGKIDTLTNAGTVTAKSYYGISLEGSGSIDTLNLSGSGSINAMGGNGQGIFFVGNTNKVTTVTLTDTSAIKASKTGINLDKSGNSIDSISVSGNATISGGNTGIYSKGTITTITVDGTTADGVLGRVGEEPETPALPKASIVGGQRGISNAGTIQTIDIKAGGLLKGGTYGIDNAGTIDAIHVTGSGSLISGGTAGIYNTRAGTIKGIMVTSGGQITGGSSGAIYNVGTITKLEEPALPTEPGASTRSKRLALETQVPEGCASAAICIQGTDSGVTSIQNGVVTSGSGDNITTSPGLIDGDIVIAGAPTVTRNGSSTAMTVTNGSGATINGSITGVVGSVSSLYNAGTIAGGITLDAGSPSRETATTLSLTNTETGVIQGAITGASGAITRIQNAGSITGNITINATEGQTVSIQNTNADGLTKGTFTFNGTGTGEKQSTLKIDNWNSKIVTGSDGNATLKPVNILGSGGKVTVDNVTITEVDGKVAHGSIDLKSVFTYGSDGQANAITIDNAKMSDELAAAGWSGNMDKANGIFQTDFSTERSAGGIIGQTLAGQLVRRDFFLDSVLTQTAANALYHRVNTGNTGLVFAKPYVSFDSFDFEGNKVSGDTIGVVGGFTGFLNEHIVTAFAGAEKSDLDSRYVNARMSLKNTSVYGGLSVARLIMSQSTFDVFGRATAKVAYTQTDIDRDLNAELSTGSTDSFAYGADAQFGANFRVSTTSRVVPVLGVGYSAGQTDDYAMNNSITLRDSYQPGHVEIPYVFGTVTWHQVWMDYLRSYVSAGVRYNLKTEQTSQATFGDAQVSGRYELPDLYEFFSVTVNMMVTPKSSFAYGYTGVFDKTGQSHNLLVKYQYLF